MSDSEIQQVLDQVITKVKILEWLNDVCNWRHRWSENSFTETMLYNYLMDRGIISETDRVIDGGSQICINSEWYTLPRFMIDYADYFIQEITTYNVIVTRNEAIEYFNNHQ